MFKKITYILIGVTALFFQNSFAQITFIVTDIPENTYENRGIYISGNFDQWSGGNKKYKLEKKDDVYFITIPKQKIDTIKFKMTQGSWNSVEIDAESKDIENRVYIVDDTTDNTIFIKVKNWKKLIDKEYTATKNVEVLANDFDIPQLSRKRRICIYLPPNYDDSKEDYPVLYMHDGQNLFDKATSINTDEWKIDETLDRLYKEKGFKLIVIGIDNDEEKRMNEYSPWKSSKYGEGEGDAYLEFIVKTLKPFIDKKYRTKSNFNNTAIMGSSMGGLISHYAGLKYRTVFGKIGVFSPTFWHSELSYKLAKYRLRNNNSKMYFLVGYDEGLEMVAGMNRMIKEMKNNQFKENNIQSKIVAGGKHNENFWSNEFEEAILWLFNK